METMTIKGKNVVVKYDSETKIESGTQYDNSGGDVL